MIDIYVKDIKVSLENKAYFSALALALTLPDICGSAEYPNESVTKRYIEWYDKYIGDDSEESDNTPELNGEIVYNLRNTFLHTGSPNINSKKVKTEKNQLDVFELILGDGTKIWSGAATIYSPIVSIRLMFINITYLCSKICKSALLYYSNNKEKFKFDFIVGLEEKMTVKTAQKLIQQDPLLQIINNKLEKIGSNQRIRSSPDRNMTKELIDSAEEAFSCLNTPPNDNEMAVQKPLMRPSTDNQLKTVKSNTNSDEKKKREAQVRSFVGQQFKDKQYVSHKKHIIEAVLKSKTKCQVNNRLMKIFSTEETSIIYKKLKPLIKDLPGK